MDKRSHPALAAVRAAFPSTVPVLTGYLVLGIAYGVLMQTKGYGVPWVLLMCCLAYCGSMQFVAITLLVTAFDPLQALLMSLMVNARHLFYGVSMLGKYRGMGAAKLPLIYTLSDETFSIVSSVEPPEDVPRKDFYLAVSLLNYGYWAAGSVLGAVAGRFITFDTTGLDFALTGLFVVLFIYGWNQYLWPLLVTNQESMYTIVMGIQRMVNIPDAVPEWNLIMAVALLGMLPPLLVVLGMQKLFVRGLVETEK